MEKYYLIYDPSDDEPLFITTNLDLAKNECEVSGVEYMELPFHI